MHASDDNQAPLPDPAIILDLIDAFRRSKTMFAALSLGVFDTLAANGPQPFQSIADDLHAGSIVRITRRATARVDEQRRLL